MQATVVCHVQLHGGLLLLISERIRRNGSGGSNSSSTEFEAVDEAETVICDADEAAQCMEDENATVELMSSLFRLLSSSNHVEKEEL